MEYEIMRQFDVRCVMIDDKGEQIYDVWREMMKEG